MKKLALLAAASTALISGSAFAQQIPNAVIAVVDVDRATNDCTACKTALTALQGQLNAYKSYQTQLATPLEAEQKSIQTAINNLNGKAPDAALTARVQAFEKKQSDANAQLAAREQTFQRNRAFVMQQIGEKLDPILSSVMTKRGATMVVDARSALKATAAVDVTNDVIAQLNSTMTSVSTTAPAGARPAAK